MPRKSVKRLLFIVMMAATTALSAEDFTENQARIGQVTGDVGIWAQGAPEWIEAKEGLPLDPGDRIRTGEDGRVELVISENTMWTLEPETELLTERMTIDVGRFQLSSGTLVGSVDSTQAAGRAQHWEINTPVAVVAIRGTQFAFQFTRAEGARLGVYEGAVEIQPAETAAGMPSPSRVNAGQEAIALRGKPLRFAKERSPYMETFDRRRREVKRRHRIVQGTWTGFTPTVRKELRLKFIAPPPKSRPPRPKTPRVRRTYKSQPQ